MSSNCRGGTSWGPQSQGTKTSSRHVLHRTKCYRMQSAASAKSSNPLCPEQQSPRRPRTIHTVAGHIMCQPFGALRSEGCCNQGLGRGGPHAPAALRPTPPCRAPAPGASRRRRRAALGPPEHAPVRSRLPRAMTQSTPPAFQHESRWERVSLMFNLNVLLASALRRCPKQPLRRNHTSHNGSAFM